MHNVKAQSAAGSSRLHHRRLFQLVFMIMKNYLSIRAPKRILSYSPGVVRNHNTQQQIPIPLRGPKAGLFIDVQAIFIEPRSAAT